MACVCNKQNRDVKTIEIDKRIKEEVKDKRIQKVLLLGTGDAGKSTFIKQLRIHFQDGFTLAEKEKYIPILRENTLQGFHMIIDACPEYNIPIPEKFSEEISMVRKSMELTKEIGKSIKNLWKSCEALQLCFEEHEHQLSLPSGHNASYFFSNALKFSERDFIPDNDDIVRSRAMSFGITETIIGKEKQFQLVDVGGQRSERRKWISCFDDSNAILYLSAVNEYDMTLEETTGVNRLEESLNLFRNITKGKWFAGIPWIVFLNKTDLLKEKLEKAHLHDCFTDYLRFVEDQKEKTEYELGISWFKHLFTTNFGGSPEMLYIYETNALDTDNCAKVWDTISLNIFDKDFDEKMGL